MSLGRPLGWRHPRRSLISEWWWRQWKAGTRRAWVRDPVVGVDGRRCVEQKRRRRRERLRQCSCGRSPSEIGQRWCPWTNG